MFPYFENIAVKNLICRVNVCAPDWGKEDDVYAFNKFYYFLEREGVLILHNDVFVPQPEELYLMIVFGTGRYEQSAAGNEGSV